MHQMQIEFEDGYDYDQDINCDDLFIKLDQLKIQLSEQYGYNWYTLSYFIQGKFWRFDWEYMWNDTDECLPELLTRAIQWAEQTLG